ncbi:hypothetical protein FJT64_021430 [Amphibalanus amphitrite]|uniref:Uncharacterized protein n=1 Tax=Amphibalanus amphitrite TaxID=1232801 RepID=A0A6A4WM70_AMPAM|nr:hypothetical protein FJT64_021430 [Amphibalanus amphitrite]
MLLMVIKGLSWCGVGGSSMSASVVTCIGCLQCGATCGQCASRARSELALPAAGIPVCLKPRVPGCSVRLGARAATRPAAAEPSARSAGPRAAPTAKDGKRIRDVCDFGDSAKVPEAVTKRKKDDQPAAAAATLDGPSAEPEMDDRPEAAASNGPTQPPSFLDSDPASVLRNVGVAQPVEREPRTKAKTGSAPA